MSTDSVVVSLESSADENDTLFKCPVCYEHFDACLSSFSQRHESHLPVRSAACAHRVCCSCLVALQAVTSGCPKWFKCPLCKAKTAFNAVDLPIDIFACECMARIEESSQCFLSSKTSTPVACQEHLAKNNASVMIKDAGRRCKHLESICTELSSKLASLKKEVNGAKKRKLER